MNLIKLSKYKLIIMIFSLNLHGSFIFGMQQALRQEINVRSAKTNDIDACVELAKQWQQEQPQWNAESCRIVYSHVFLKLGNILIAQDEQKKIIGMLLAIPCPLEDGETYLKDLFAQETININFNFFTTHQDKRAFFVHELYVDESCRGKGVGKMLLQTLSCQSPLAQKLYLMTSLNNQKAMGFYNHLGFTSLAQTDDSDILLTIDTNKLGQVK